MPSTSLSSTTAGFIQLGVLLLLLAAVYVPFGNYMAGTGQSAGGKGRGSPRFPCDTEVLIGFSFRSL